MIRPKRTKLIKIKGNTKLNKVWQKLMKQLPNEYHDLNLFYSKHNVHDYELRKGGWSSSAYIVMGEDLLKLNDTYIYVSFLAHELGHQILGHNQHYDDSNTCNEKDADHFGLFLAMKAGYSASKYLKAGARYEKWRKKGIKKSHVVSHGTAKERQALLKRQLEYLGWRSK
jgi:hypothetical protein